jgi:hypothetical protein
MEPNTSLVKWVLEKDLFTSYAKVAEYQERDNIAVPVIPMANLTELVEGLRTIAYADWSPELNKEISAAMERGELKHMTGVEWLAQRLLTQLEAHKKEDT